MKGPPNPKDDPSYAEWQALPDHVKVPYQLEHGALMVRAKINGHELRLPFDTGASTCSVNIQNVPATADELPLAKAEIVGVGTPYGLLAARKVTTEVQLDDLSRKVSILVFRLPRPVQPPVIGAEFIKGYSYEIDKAYIRLTKVPYGRGQQSALSAESDKFSVPYELYQNTMVIPITINGVETKATFDTGDAAPGIAIPRDNLQSSMRTSPN